MKLMSWNSVPQTVRASRSFEPVFRHRIIKQQAKYIGILLLDDDEFRMDYDSGDDSELTYLPHITLIWPLAFMHVRKLTLGRQISDALVRML